MASTILISMASLKLSLQFSFKNGVFTQLGCSLRSSISSGGTQYIAVSESSLGRWFHRCGVTLTWSCRAITRKMGIIWRKRFHWLLTVLRWQHLPFLKMLLSPPPPFLELGICRTGVLNRLRGFDQPQKLARRNSLRVDFLMSQEATHSILHIKSKRWELVNNYYILPGCGYHDYILHIQNIFQTIIFLIQSLSLPGDTLHNQERCAF